MGKINWRVIHYLSYLLTLFFALEPSYIHPDEHFQSLQVLTHKIYNWNLEIPWEFSEATPSRSFSVLYLVYGPLLYLNKWLNWKPLAILYLARLQLVVSFWIVAELSTKILCKSRQEQTKSLFFIFTSYVTWTYQSHTFSNSIESGLLLLALSLIHIQREEGKRKDAKPLYLLNFILGTVTSIGIFNRITFAMFMFLPALTQIKNYWKFKLSAVLLALSFALVSYIQIVIDTKIFNSHDFIITPFNNLMYNTKVDNLAHHGIHARYTHILINLPQLLGPVLIPFIFRNHHKSSIPYLSVLSGVLLLSVVPHQELRFLTPIVPLVCICIDFTNFEDPITTEWIIRAWCLFNIILGIIMGSFHQRGVIDALSHLQTLNLENATQLWWKTYSPPTWILGDYKLKKNEVIDLMGLDIEQLPETIAQCNTTEVLLVTSRSSVPLLESTNETVHLEAIWSSNWHLDMDHFDISDMRTFYPGIDIYRVSLL